METDPSPAQIRTTDDEPEVNARESIRCSTVDVSSRSPTPSTMWSPVQSSIGHTIRSSISSMLIRSFPAPPDTPHILPPPPPPLPQPVLSSITSSPRPRPLPPLPPIPNKYMDSGLRLGRAVQDIGYQDRMSSYTDSSGPSAKPPSYKSR